jgi:ubiquinone/menaquinone biosynthesis C-methylase UbiE
MSRLFYNSKSRSRPGWSFYFRIAFIQILFLAALLFGQVGDEQNRDDWQQPERIMDSVGVKTGMKIGEVGAGEGYFTIQLANRVGMDGLVYANDISDTKLNKLREHLKHQNISNVRVVKGKEDDPLFPETGLDMIIMVYVFHDLSDPVNLMENAKKYLSPGAPVVIVDRDPDRYGNWSSHFMSRNEIVEKVEQEKYRIVKTFTFLTRDNIYICLPQQTGDESKSDLNEGNTP